MQTAFRYHFHFGRNLISCLQFKLNALAWDLFTLAHSLRISWKPSTAIQTKKIYSPHSSKISAPTHTNSKKSVKSKSVLSSVITDAARRLHHINSSIPISITFGTERLERSVRTLCDVILLAGLSAVDTCVRAVESADHVTTTTLAVVPAASESTLVRGRYLASL